MDGNNVMGSVADGWWRDRRAAVMRLASRLSCHQERTDDRVVLVLDSVHPDLPEGDGGGVEIRYPRRKGRDAADERILELLASYPAASTVVVTSDRALASAARVGGFEVVGARTLLSALDGSGC